MKRLQGLIRSAVEAYGMIEEGDRIAVGLSGGKDSLALLTGLAGLRDYYPANFSLQAITLDLGFEGGGDFDALAAHCARLEVPFLLERTEIGPLIFDRRAERHPCALCARLRRGALNRLAVQQGCNKVALGHHLDDAVETLLLMLFYEGRLGSFYPVTALSRTGLTVIRPLILMEEREVARLAARLRLPVMYNPCCANGNTKRQEVKQLLAELERGNPGLRRRIFGALRRSGLYGWGAEETPAEGE
ncbi:MAG: tRNA 2-thiocytidine(32) synthetase TtcA [Clostridiales bacterium]|nr:tRNA 2-thiocytidine(32) synthetase TtcA [Clostridiales bacterium]